MDSNEKQQLAGFLNLIWTYLADEAPTPEAKNVILMTSWESSSLGDLQSGLNMTLQVLADSDPAQIDRFNQELIAHGLPTIADLEDQDYRRCASILSRGFLANDHEYYLIKTILDANDDRFTQEQLFSGGMLVDNYETTSQ